MLLQSVEESEDIGDEGEDCCYVEECKEDQRYCHMLKLLKEWRETTKWWQCRGNESRREMEQIRIPHGQERIFGIYCHGYKLRY